MSAESLPIGGRRPPLQGACGALRRFGSFGGHRRTATKRAGRARRANLQNVGAWLVPVMAVRPRVYPKRPTALERTAGSFPA